MKKCWDIESVTQSVQTMANRFGTLARGAESGLAQQAGVNEKVWDIAAQSGSLANWLVVKNGLKMW